MSRRNFSIRLPDDVIATLDKLALQVGFGITRNNIIESACEWYVLQCRANSGRPMMEIDQQDVIAYIRSKHMPHALRVAEESPEGKGSRDVAQDSEDTTARRPTDPRNSEKSKKYQIQKKAKS